MGCPPIGDRLNLKSDLETRNLLPVSHCEHLKGACLHAEVSACGGQHERGATARRRGNLIEKDEIASVPSQ